MQPRDVVDGVCDDGGHDEGVAGGGDDVGDLDVHLSPVVIDEAAVDDASVDTVETDNVISAEEGVEEETEHAGDAMLSKHVEGVVDSEEEFDCREHHVRGRFDRDW